MVKCKIVFIIVAGSEAEVVQPFYQRLVQRKDTDVLNIHTGMLCCGSGEKQAEITLRKLNMKHKALSDYNAKNIVEVIKSEQPDVVVVGNDQEYVRRAFLFAAEGLGIPTLLLHLGIGSNAANITSIAVSRTAYRLTHNFTNIVKKYSHLLRVVIALRWSLFRITKMIYKDIYVAFAKDNAGGEFGERLTVVACEWEKDILIERGVNPRHIFVMGNQKFGAVSQGQGTQDRENMRLELGFGDNDKVILLLTCAQIEHGRWTYNRRSQFVNGVIDAVSPLLNDSVHLVIKIHPTENIDGYQEYIAGRKERIVLSKVLQLGSIIQASDVVLVGGYSTVVIESAVLGKPVLLLSPFGEREEIAFVDMGLAVKIDDMRDIRGAVERLLYNQSARDELLSKARSFFDTNKELVDGKATTRISGLILELAKSHHRG